MTQEQIINLMKSSRNSDEWNRNCDTVKKACKGYPDFWYKEIVLSGLMDRTLGAGSSELKISVINF